MKTIGRIVETIVAIAAFAAGIAFIFERFEKSSHKPFGIYEKYIKRPLDAFLATGALIVLSPVLLVTAILVRLKLGMLVCLLLLRLHSHIRSYASLFIPIAKKSGLITIVHSHSTSSGSGIKAIVKNLLQLPLRYQADYFISCSSKAGEWLFGRNVVASKKHFIVKNAIDIEKYRYNYDVRQKMRGNLGLGDNTVLGHVGGFRDPKNHEFIVDVFKEYHAINHNSILVLVGDGDLKNHIENQVRQYHLDDAVIFTGSRNDVPDLLQAFDYFVFPSKWEGLPVSVIEAQASGLHCLISDKITSEVKISPLVKCLSIDNGTRLWVDNILSTPINRSDYTQEIISAGYDMEEVSKSMMHFYSSIYNRAFA